MIPLVLVHGFMGGSAQWEALQSDLEGAVDMIAVDLPGFGANNHLPALSSIKGFAQWVVDELRRKGVERYNLLGHSMGGMISQEIARLDQEHINRLVLYGTGATGVLPGRFETIEESKKRAEQDGPTATARRISATWFLQREDASGYAGCAAIAEQSAAQAIAAGLDAMQSWSGVDFLPRITPETLVIWGEKDRTYPWEQTQELSGTIPNAQLAIMPDCAHAAHLEKPDIFAGLLYDFLQPGS